MNTREVNFDGLIGPTHNYAGLSTGNIASSKNAHLVSHPRQAALEGLEKMRTLMRLGYTQGFLPPQCRPRLDILRQLGFQGSDDQVIQRACQQEPRLLAMVYSASSMWAANAATVTPSIDSHDGKVHFTPANLVTTAHRAMEHTETQAALNTLFADKRYFSVHAALPSHECFADEGAANHTRLSLNYGQAGVGLFVYGRDEQPTTQHFPARQTLKASQAIARQQGVTHPVFLQQNPAAIDAGAFHNDVVAVGNGPVLFFHQEAFVADQQVAAFEQIKKHIPEFHPIMVPSSDVSMTDAIQSYLFNSQLLASPCGAMDKMHLIAPTECENNPAVKAYLDRLVLDTSQPIQQVTYVNVRQSMSNGGGPACLRLRVVLTEEELQAVAKPYVFRDESQIDALCEWVKTYYREDLYPSDLQDPQLKVESDKALQALKSLLTF